MQATPAVPPFFPPPLPFITILTLPPHTHLRNFLQGKPLDASDITTLEDALEEIRKLRTFASKALNSTHSNEAIARGAGSMSKSIFHPLFTPLNSSLTLSFALFYPSQGKEKRPRRCRRETELRLLRPLRKKILPKTWRSQKINPRCNHTQHPLQSLFWR